MPKRVPSYRLHKPSGQAVVTLCGRDFYLGPWRSRASKQEYDRLTGEWMANGRRLPSAEGPGDLSIVELLAAYLAFAKTYYVKDGNATGELALVKLSQRLVRHAYGNSSANDFGPLALKAIQQRLVDQGLSRPYINAHVDRIRRMFKWAASEELIAESVYRALMTVPGLKKGRTSAIEPEPVRPVPDADLEATLPELPAVVRAMVQFQRFTGCRPGEACLLRPMDIDRTDVVWCYTPRTHKTEHHDRVRRIFIGPRAQAELLPWLLRPAEAYCFSPKESKPSAATEPRPPRRQKKAKGTSRRGERYRKDGYYRAIARACERAGVTPWSPNQLRHSRATEIRHSFGIEAAQVVLGHARADVTQVYAERDSETARRIMEKVG